MMRRTLRNPAFEERPHVRTEKDARVRVASRWDWAVHAFAFSDDELELSLRSDADAQHRDRPLLDLELDARAAARLAVVLEEAAQHWLALRDVDVVRTVVANQHEPFAEINRVKFCEAAANP